MTAPGWSPAATLELRPGLHLLETRVDDFDVRAAIVLGRDRALVWDTLAHPMQMTPAARLIGRRPVTVAYSHGDWDHIQGTAALGEVQEVVAHAACRARFVSEVPAELQARVRAEPGRWDAVRLFAPTRTFTGWVGIDLGGVTVRVEHLPGHTGDCTVAWIPEWGVLLAGDTVETPLPVVEDAAAIGGWLERLGRWAREPGLECVVPSHGHTGGPDVIAETIVYLDTLRRGGPWSLPGGTAPFYLRTHEENVRRVGAAGSGA